MSVAEWSFIWRGADVLSRRMPAGDGAPRARRRSARWRALLLHQPARDADAGTVLRPLRPLHLGEAARGRPVYQRLVAREDAADGLHGTQDAARADRATRSPRAIPSIPWSRFAWRSLPGARNAVIGFEFNLGDYAISEFPPPLRHDPAA